ncbi:MAG: hypothetical protein HRU76_01620 [Phycisphaeraceae bacterium]|nr:hypothetical protein [Phycisphaerales bacterium]QOJ16366.1 MAG: hypothetical protein HRU76_01620 [Phycisphaeraceae bacterium]
MASLRKRGRAFQIQYFVGGKQKRVSLGRIPYQMAKAKLAQFELAQLQGLDNPLPSKTRIAEVLTAYVAHIRAFKTPKAAQTDIYYLREVFGPVCEAVTITRRRSSAAARKRPSSQLDGRKRLPVIEAMMGTVNSDSVGHRKPGQFQGSG